MLQQLSMHWSFNNWPWVKPSAIHLASRLQYCWVWRFWTHWLALNQNPNLLWVNKTPCLACKPQHLFLQKGLKKFPFVNDLISRTKQLCQNQHKKLALLSSACTFFSCLLPQTQKISLSLDHSDSGKVSKGSPRVTLSRDWKDLPRVVTTKTWLKLRPLGLP